MQSLSSFLRRLPLVTLIAGIALATGLLVPTVFEWGQKPAARSRHWEMELAAAAVLVVTMVACVICWWRCKPVQDPPHRATNAGSLQFGIRGILAVTTLAALLMAFSAVVKSSEFASGLVAGLALGIAGWSLFQDQRVRSRVGALLASLFLPFVWMIAYNEPLGYTSGLAVNIPIGPAVFPSLLVQNLLENTRIDEFEGFAAALVIVELLVGVWLARRGGKLSVAFVIAILVLSSLSSLVLHVLYRM